jgi:hypothetical protein
MDYFTKELVTAIEKIRSDLNAIKEAISALPADIQNQLDATRENDNAHEESDNTEPRSVVAELSTPVAIRVQAETNERNSIRKILETGIQILGVGAVIWYACINSSMLDQMKQATNVARESDRPWIGPVTVNPVKSKGGFKVHISFVNGGRRPARVIEAKGSSHIYKLFPESPSYGSEVATKPSRTITVANKVSSLDFDAEVSDREMAGLDESTVLYFYAIVRYEDVAGDKLHTTKMCWFYVPNDKSTGTCSGYNDAD